MKTLGIGTVILIVGLLANSCDGPVAASDRTKKNTNEQSLPALAPSDDILMTIAQYEWVATHAWSKASDRLLSGEEEVRVQTEQGEVGFLRGDGDDKHDKPPERYLMGGAISGFIEIIRRDNRVERVVLRPGRLGFSTSQTTVTLFEHDEKPLFTE